MPALLRRLISGLLCALSLGTAVVAQSEAAKTAITVHSALLPGRQIATGVRILLEGERVSAVGKVADIAIPEGSAHHEFATGFLMPGLIDAASHFGLSRHKNDLTVAVLPDVQMRDVVAAKDSEVHAALRMGVTTLNLLPGDGNLVGGRTALARPRKNGRLGFWFPAASALHVSFDDRAWPREIPPTSLIGGMETLGELFATDPLKSFVQGPGRVLVSAPNARDVDAAAATAERLGLLPLLFTTEAGAGRAAVHAKRFRGVVLSALAPDLSPLERQGLLDLFATEVPVAFGTRSLAAERLARLRLSSITARRLGIAPERALAALTEDPSQMLGLGSEAGLLRVGSVADLTVWSGDPSDPRSRLLQVWQAGHLAHAASGQESLR